MHKVKMTSNSIFNIVLIQWKSNHKYQMYLVHSDHLAMQVALAQLLPAPLKK